MKNRFILLFSFSLFFTGSVIAMITKRLPVTAVCVDKINSKIVHVGSSDEKTNDFGFGTLNLDTNEYREDQNPLYERLRKEERNYKKITKISIDDQNQAYPVFNTYKYSGVDNEELMSIYEEFSSSIVHRDSDGNLLCHIGKDGNSLVLTPKHPKKPKNLIVNLPEGDISIALNKDKTHLAVVDGCGVIRILDITKEKDFQLDIKESECVIGSKAVSVDYIDNETLAVGSENGRVTFIKPKLGDIWAVEKFAELGKIVENKIDDKATSWKDSFYQFITQYKIPFVCLTAVVISFVLYRHYRA